jgi:glycosyltransferase 2 family protein
MPARRSAFVRLLVGIVISAVFLGITLRNVDLGKAADAIGRAAPAGLAVALVIVLIDLSLRALRWHVLLRAVEDATVPPPYRLAFGYLTLGFAANFVLPARLGDIARAVLAADAFKAPRLAIFGTILIERVSDGLTFLGLAILSSLVVASASELRALTVYAVLLAVGGLIAAAVGWLAITRTALASTRVAAAIMGIVRRLTAGAGAFRHVRSAASFLILTALLATTATLVAWAVLQAVGVNLSPVQTVLFLSGIALSLAIPAAPGAIGTYEFVGVAIITGLGYTPEQGLATILLMRILTTFPSALIGLVSIWALHVRPGAIAESAEAPAAEVEAT